MSPWHTNLALKTVMMLISGSGLAFFWGEFGCRWETVLISAGWLFAVGLFLREIYRWYFGTGRGL